MFCIIITRLRITLLLFILVKLQSLELILMSLSILNGKRWCSPNYRLSMTTVLGLSHIVIKPRPARQVDSGLGGWTGPGLSKDWPAQRLGQTRSTRWVNPWPGRDPNFFFQMWDLKLISIYTLCSQEKSYVFSMWDKKSFWFKYFNLKG
jgi:hypothetical protein